MCKSSVPIAVKLPRDRNMEAVSLNSLYYNLPKSQLNRLQQIQNCLARTVVKAPKSSHITPILRSLRTRSSSLVNLAPPSVSSSLQVTNRSFTYASPHLWNQLPSSFRQPHSVHCPPGSPHPAHITSSQSSPSLSPYHSIDLSLLDLKLISFTNPFLYSHFYSFRTDFADLNLYCIKGHWRLFVLVSFSDYVC